MKSDVLAKADHLVERYPALQFLRDDIVRAAQMIIDCHHRQNLVLVCGNGGSAADSAHIVAELMKGFLLPRKFNETQRDQFRKVLPADESASLDRLQLGIRAVNLAENASLNTAVSNDLSGDLIFAQSVFALGRKGDVVIGISTSGNSKNVIRAMQVARANGMHTIGLTGQNPGKMDAYCDVNIKVPALHTYQVQEFHLPVYHAICAMVEAELFG